MILQWQCNNTKKWEGKMESLIFSSLKAKAKLKHGAKKQNQVFFILSILFWWKILKDTLGSPIFALKGGLSKYQQLPQF